VIYSIGKSWLIKYHPNIMKLPTSGNEHMYFMKQYLFYLFNIFYSHHLPFWQLYIFRALNWQGHGILPRQYIPIPHVKRPPTVSRWLFRNCTCQFADLGCAKYAQWDSSQNFVMSCSQMTWSQTLASTFSPLHLYGTRHHPLERWIHGHTLL
jgi:hypothetical protein